MAEITITASDGGSFFAYLAEPKARPAGAVVVIQEILGVNAAMPATCSGVKVPAYSASSVVRGRN